MNDFSSKTEQELQAIIDDAFKFTSASRLLAAEKTIEVLLVIAERNRRHIEYIERKNQIYTYLIIGLSAAAILTQLLPLFLKK
jgi:hypothetical protein